MRFRKQSTLAYMLTNYNDLALHISKVFYLLLQLL